MTAGAVWRLSLLPAWGLAGGGPVSGLFALPATLLIMLIVPFLQWLTLPRETLPAWRRWSGKWIVSWSVFFALLQVFVLAHSLGLVSPPALGWGRLFLVYMGIVFMMVGNATPKTPSVPQRNSFELDPWRQNRMFRFIGKLLFGLGLAFALGGVLLPLEYWRPVFLCLMLAALTAGIRYGVKLRHEARDKALGDA
jgi:hypothetical protein